MMDNSQSPKPPSTFVSGTHDATGTGRVKVVLADAQALFREALRIVLDEQDDVTVVAESSTLTDGLDQARRTDAHVLVLAPGEAVRTGLDVARTAHGDAPDCHVLLVTDDDEQILLLDALEAGVRGFVTKSSPVAELIDAVRAVGRGETVVPPHMLGPLLAQLIRQRRARDAALRQIGQLTAREQQVLALLADGGDNQSIARRLVISPETARTHIHNLLAKLEVHSRLEAVSFVMHHNLLETLTQARR